MIKNLLIAFILAVLPVYEAVSQTYTLMGTGCNEKVLAIAPDPANSSGVYAGGEFLNADGNTVNYIAKWNGTNWVSMNSGTNFYVRSIFAQSATDIYVGGAFNLVGNPVIASWGIAKWNGTSWSAMANGIRGEVYAITSYNSEIYAGGAFDTLNGFNPGRGILKWNGSTWITLGGAIGDGVAGPPGFKVKALQEFNGELYVGGTFVSAGGITVNNIAKWNGSAWSAIGSGTNGEVNAFTILNGELYVGGSFTTANGVLVNGVAKITGNTFAAIGGGVNGLVNGLAPAGTFLYVTGEFDSAGTVYAQNIAKWDGTNWDNVGLGLNFDGYCLTPQGSDMYIGGFFSVAGTVFANNVCRYLNAAVGIHEPLSDLNISIRPNPTSDYLVISSESLPENCSYKVTDISGRLLKRGTLHNQTDSEYRISLDAFSPGTYFLTLEKDKSEYTSKFVIQ